MTSRRTSLIVVFLCLSCAMAVCQTTIRRVTVFPKGNGVQVEVDASAPVTPETQSVVNPDRLVLDFPNSVPASTLRNVSVNRGPIRGVRAGLFAANPPVTRIVVDLDAPQPFEVFASGSTTVLKLNSPEDHRVAVAHPSPSPVQASAAAPAPVNVQPAAPPPPRMQVEFKNGKLKISSDHASLAEVLTEVRRRTGADITVPPSAAQEQVFGTLGPAAPRDVMAALLNGSHFNFVVVGADDDPSQLRSVLLTPRDGGPVTVSAIPEPPPQAQPQPSGIVDVPPDPNEAATAPEDAPPVDESPNADLAGDPNAADNDAPAEPDMAPGRHRRHRGPTTEQPENPEPPQ